MANHERIHMLQAESFKTKYFGFYCYYIGYWIKNLFKYGFNMDAYDNIPFEREAYANELNFEYNETHWRDYVDWYLYFLYKSIRVLKKILIFFYNFY